MDAQRFGIVIKVNELECCRLFYRDLLDLGEPMIDSSFFTVFQLQPGLTLTLEKSPAKYLERASSTIEWRFETANLTVLKQRLEAAGYALEFDELHRGPGRYWRGRDPEGNFFLVREAE